MWKQPKFKKKKNLKVSQKVIVFYYLLFWDNENSWQTRTDEQEDEDGDGHHEWSVSIERDGLDDPRFKDLIPPEGQTHITWQHC